MIRAAEAETVALAALRRVAGRTPAAVLIGGYAVSSYAFVRTSVDLDLVIGTRNLDSMSGDLQDMRFSRTKSKRVHGGRYAGEFQLWRHGSGARVDLLVGGVQDRNVGVWVPHTYVRRNSEERAVRAIFEAPPVRCAVATRELLIGLKLQPFRLVDQRDIFALCFDPLDARRVKRHIERMGGDLLTQRLLEMREITRKRAFEDSFKGVYRVASPRVMSRVRRNLASLMREVGSD